MAVARWVGQHIAVEQGAKYGEAQEACEGQQAGLHEDAEANDARVVLHGARRQAEQPAHQVKLLAHGEEEDAQGGGCDEEGAACVLVAGLQRAEGAKERQADLQSDGNGHHHVRIVFDESEEGKGDQERCCQAD